MNDKHLPPVGVRCALSSSFFGDLGLVVLSPDRPGFPVKTSGGWPATMLAENFRIVIDTEVDELRQAGTGSRSTAA